MGMKDEVIRMIQCFDDDDILIKQLYIVLLSNVRKAGKVVSEAKEESANAEK